MAFTITRVLRKTLSKTLGGFVASPGPIFWINFFYVDRNILISAKKVFILITVVNMLTCPVAWCTGWE